MCPKVHVLEVVLSVVMVRDRAYKRENLVGSHWVIKDTVLRGN